MKKTQVAANSLHLRLKLDIHNMAVILANDNVYEIFKLEINYY